jgi:uncharacterized protein (DUF2336 family)
MSDNKLSQDDIDALISNPTSETKIGLIDKIAQHYNSSDFSDLQRERAERIFRNLIGDTEIEVRKAISDQLLNNTDVPADIVLSLAKDIEEVACPMLEFSEVISEADLLEIIGDASSEAHMVAIANRKTVPDSISNALIESENENVVSTLLDNQGSDVPDEGYDKVISSFSENENVIDSLATRSVITEKIVKKMVDAISESMKQRLEGRYQTNIEDLHKLFDVGNEGATMKLLGQQTISDELLDLVDSLSDRGQLLTALGEPNSFLSKLLADLGKSGQYPIIPALAVGNLTLFCIILNKTTNLPFENIVKLVNDARGNEALYIKARLPKRMFDCVNVVIDTIKLMHAEGKAGPNAPIRNDLALFIRCLQANPQGMSVNQLHNFVEIVEHNIEEESGGW